MDEELQNRVDSMRHLGDGITATAQRLIDIFTDPQERWQVRVFAWRAFERSRKEMDAMVEAVKRDMSDRVRQMRVNEHPASGSGAGAARAGGQ